jgi:undecaprenyl-diphosphatase
MIATVFDSILHLHGWPALALVFALPALEASVFLGFLFPGEIAIVLGGVLAFEHHLWLPAAVMAAVLGAVVGDSVGYFVGRRFGQTILRSTLGRLPLWRRHFDRHLEEAKAYLRRRGPYAVVIGRFTAWLRVFVPGLAGMSAMPYRTFVVFNVLGGLVWGTGFVLLGFFAGLGWRHVERLAGAGGLAFLVVLAAVLLGARARRRSRPGRPERTSPPRSA